ncbi:MAG TPA: twin-arginine translocase subunit TatC [Acidimicrobiia bacterium]|nr:twin-arginine translocase subunit TatC [Acidimicrobiia bacterium]
MTADRPQSILSHLEELRWRLVKIAIAVVAAGAVALIFAEQITEILEGPFDRAAPDSSLQTLAVGEQWGVLMRIGLFGGILIGSPVVLYQIWAFVNPALTNKERKWAIPIVASLVVLFVGGVGFGYWALPRGLEFLLDIFPGVETDLQIGQYYSFTLRFLLAFGLAFLYPVFLYASAAAGVISAEQLARGRRWAIVIIVIGAALITPSGDAFTLLILSGPLYLMYEATYWLVRLTLRK